MARRSRAREDLGSFDRLTPEETAEARRKLASLFPNQPSIFRSGADLDRVEAFMQRGYKPEDVHTVGAYRLALKELKSLGVNVPPYSHLRLQEIENLYYQIKSNIRTELKRVGKLSKLER